MRDKHASSRERGTIAEGEIIVAAAIERRGLIYSVPRPGRHHDIIREMARAGIPIPITGQQGFVTSTGRFVGRKKARKLAEAASQLIPCGGKDEVPFIRQHSELFSEDVW